MIVADSSPLIILARINCLHILKALFGVIYIPTAVHQETVLETQIQQQKEAISQAIDASAIIVRNPTVISSFNRRLGRGEQGVLNLAREINARGIIMDDKKARNEAKAFGFFLIYTTDILRRAEQRGLIISYIDVLEQLKTLNIYLPS